MGKFLINQISDSDQGPLYMIQISRQFLGLSTAVQYHLALGGKLGSDLIVLPVQSFAIAKYFHF